MTEDQPDTVLPVALRPSVAERLESVAARRGLSLAELVQRLAIHLASIAEIIPDAALRPQTLQEQQS